MDEVPTFQMCITIYHKNNKYKGINQSTGGLEPRLRMLPLELFYIFNCFKKLWWAKPHEYETFNHQDFIWMGAAYYFY